MDYYLMENKRLPLRIGVGAILINKEKYLTHSFSGVFGNIRDTKSLFFSSFNTYKIAKN